MIRPKTETEYSLLSSTENCEMPLKQTHPKPEETLDFKLTKPRQSFHFTSPIPIEESWMIGLTSLQVYNLVFNITTTNNKFELYADTFDKVSFTDLKDELEEFHDISNMTSENLQEKIK